LLQSDPIGRFPHELVWQKLPVVHWVSFAQNVEHREPEQPRNGAQDRVPPG
jgi:hypothetical protein